MISLAKKAVVMVPMLASALSAPVVRTVRLDGNRFIPAELQANPGDTLRFVNGNGGPHNVEFIADSMARPARLLFEASMPGGRAKLGPTSGPLLVDPDEAYSFVVPDVAPGRYAFLCLPHQTNMKGALVVTK